MSKDEYIKFVSLEYYKLELEIKKANCSIAKDTLKQMRKMIKKTNTMNEVLDAVKLLK
jgi:hypothetical protein